MWDDMREWMALVRKEILPVVVPFLTILALPIGASLWVFQKFETQAVAIQRMHGSITSLQDNITDLRKQSDLGREELKEGVSKIENLIRSLSEKVSDLKVSLSTTEVRSEEFGKRLGTLEQMSFREREKK